MNKVRVQWHVNMKMKEKEKKDGQKVVGRIGEQTPEDTGLKGREQHSENNHSMTHSFEQR